MNLDDLIEQLTEIRDDLDSRGFSTEDITVRIAIQPNYPIEFGVANLTVHRDTDGDDPENPNPETEEVTVYLAASDSSKYAPNVWQ